MSETPETLETYADPTDYSDPYYTVVVDYCQFCREPLAQADLDKVAYACRNLHPYQQESAAADLALLTEPAVTDRAPLYEQATFCAGCLGQAIRGTLATWDSETRSWLNPAQVADNILHGEQ